MLELQRRLQSRFDSLRDTRSGSVFFVEHGLSEGDLDELTAVLRETLAAHSLEEPGWSSHPLPLIVAATEVGYQYRGTGTDFWPVLEEQLAINFSPMSRQRVRDLFAAAAARYRGACPPDSPWSRAFRLIAWPITHALIPFEFHRPLAAALANLNARVRGLGDDDLYTAVRRAAGRVSARFEAWLSDPHLVVLVVRYFFGENTTELAENALERIRADLTRDDVARGALATARRMQSVAQESERARTRSAPPPVRGLLQLRRREGQLFLEGVFPRLDARMLEPVRRELRRHRYAPQLWRVSARIPGEQLISGNPFLLKLLSAVQAGVELLPGLPDLEISEEHRMWLQALQLEFIPPVIFSRSMDGALAKEVRDFELLGTKRYWLVGSQELAKRFVPLSKIGDVGPYVCVEIDPTRPITAEALQRLGYHVRSTLAVDFAGPPSLERDAMIPTYVAGDRRIVALRRSHPLGTVVRLPNTGQQIALEDDILAQVTVQEGQHDLAIQTENESRDYRIRGASRLPAAIPECWVDLVAPELTVQALLAGAVSLRVDSLAPLEGAELTVELETSGRRFGVSTLLGPLPAIIPGDSDLWETLLDGAPRRELLRGASAVLFARVGAIAANFWPLEQRVRSCWWEKQGTTVSLKSELGDHSFGGVPAAQPLETPNPRIKADGTDTVLLVPLDLDLPTYGPSAAFATCCVAPTKMRLDAPVVRKPRLRRRRRGGRGSTGLEDLLEAYLRWSLAESTSFLAEIRRRQVAAQIDSWISEICCGERWTEREIELRQKSSDPWQLLRHGCEESGLGSDPQVTLPPGGEADLASLAVDEIRRTIPDLWTRVGPPMDLDGTDYEALDLACGRAYARLEEDYRGKGQEDAAAAAAEGDPGNDPETWIHALGRVKARAELHPLAELLLPSDSAARLIDLDYTLMSQEDILDEFVRWSRRARRALTGDVPDPSVLRAILALWLTPETAVNLDWQDALDTLLADRCISRAARYMCLRGRDLGGGRNT